MSETKQHILQAVFALLVAAGMMLGLVLIQHGGESIFFADGTDHAEVSLEQTNTLDIISTRYITLTPEGIGGLIGGGVVMAVTLIVAQRANAKRKPVPSKTL